MPDPAVVAELDLPANGARQSLAIRALAFAIVALLTVGTTSAVLRVGQEAPLTIDRSAPVRLAAATSAATAEDVAMVVTVSTEDDAAPFRTELAFDVDTRNYTVVFASPTFRSELIVVGGEAFITVPDPQPLNRQTVWMRLPSSAPPSADAPPPTAPINPLDRLGALGRITGPVERVGTEEIRGVKTTHYRTTVDETGLRRTSPGAAPVDPESLRKVPYEVWIDDQDRPRRTRTTSETTRPNGDRRTSVTTAELYDYGKPVVVMPPPPELIREFDAARYGPFLPQPPG